VRALHPHGTLGPGTANFLASLDLVLCRSAASFAAFICGKLRINGQFLKIILSTVFGGSKLAIFPARWDLGHEANPKNTKPMKEPLDLALRSGSEPSSSRWPKRFYGRGGSDSGKAERPQNRLSGWGCPPGTPPDAGQSGDRAKMVHLALVIGWHCRKKKITGFGSSNRLDRLDRLGPTFAFFLLTDDSGTAGVCDGGGGVCVGGWWRGGGGLRLFCPGLVESSHGGDREATR
jgi:hypothetical protein